MKTKLHLKVFTQDSAENLEAEVNEWISDQYPMIDIENVQVSTTTVSNKYDNNTIQTEFHAAIWYHKL